AERWVEHLHERALRDRVHQVRGEPLAARERFLWSTRAEGDADDRGALASDLVQVALADATRVAADAHEPRLEREHADVVGQHRAAGVVADGVEVRAGPRPR